MWILLVRAIIGIFLLLGTAFYLFTPTGRKYLAQIVLNFVGGSIDVAAQLSNELSPGLNTVVTSVKTAFATHGAELHNNLKQPFTDLAKQAFTTIADPLINQGPIDPADWKSTASDALGDAFGLGMASWGVTAAFEALLPEKLNVLNGAGPMLATMAGFAEVSGAALGPLLNAAVKQPATYDINSKLRPLLPDIGRALELHARRLITDDDLNVLLAYNGINPKWTPAVIASSYRPLQPRALAAAIGEYNFDRAQVTDVLKFAGLRDADVDLMINALVQRGLQPLRQALINETITLAGQGLLSDSDVASTLQAENLTDDAINLINQRIALLRLHTMATLTKTELIAAAKERLITVDQLGADLSATGYQDAEVQIIQNTVSQFLTAKEAAAAARQLSADEAKAQQLTIRSAQQSFKRGEIDLATFAAELTATGLSIERVAAYTSLAAVQNEPTLRAGTQLSAFALKQQSAKLAIKTLSEEFKKGAIDEATVRAGLAANGMSPNDIDATVNYVNAVNIKAASATAATVPLASTNGTAAG